MEVNLASAGDSALFDSQGGMAVGILEVKFPAYGPVLVPVGGAPVEYAIFARVLFCIAFLIISLLAASSNSDILGGRLAGTRICGKVDEVPFSKLSACFFCASVTLSVCFFCLETDSVN